MAKSRRIREIDCLGTAVAGIRMVLTARLDEMCELRQSALDFKDPEGVHSMRVASRRLRSALHDFRPYVNKGGLAATLKQIRSIADALGEVRDEDVAILALETVASHSSAQMKGPLQAIIESRKEARRTARQQLRKIIVKKRMSQLALDFDKAITTATNAPEQNNTLSYVNMAREIIRDRLDELESLSNGLYKPLDEEPLHEMRIAAKRLRYAIELFQECWSSGLEGFAKSAAGVQSALGNLHDCDVWITSFGKEIVKSKESKELDQCEAFVFLLSHFLRVRNRHLRDAFSQWKAWETEGLGLKLRELIKS